uniref:Tail length tape measure protein n=1 Tax=Xanthomonas phage MK21 TaxID=3148942 RepID=A0AAU7J8T1_9CAUD
MVFDVLRHKGITGDDRDELMRWLSVAETAALSQLAKN